MKIIVVLLCIALPLVCAIGKPHFPSSYHSTATFYSKIKGATTNLTDGNVYFDLPNRRIHLEGTSTENNTVIENFDFFLNGTQYIRVDKVCIGYELQGQYGDPLRLVRYTHYDGTIEISRNGHFTSAYRWLFKQGTVQIEILTRTSDNNKPLRVSISQDDAYTIIDYFDFKAGVSPSDFSLPSFCFDMDKRGDVKKAPSLFQLCNEVASSIHL